MYPAWPNLSLPTITRLPPHVSAGSSHGATRWTTRAVHGALAVITRLADPFGRWPRAVQKWICKFYNVVAREKKKKVLCWGSILFGAGDLGTGLLAKKGLWI